MELLVSLLPVKADEKGIFTLQLQAVTDLHVWAQGGLGTEENQKPGLSLVIE